MFVLFKKHRTFHTSTSTFALYAMNHCFSAKETSAEATFVRNAEAQLPPILHAKVEPHSYTLLYPLFVFTFGISDDGVNAVTFRHYVHLTKNSSTFG